MILSCSQPWLSGGNYAIMHPVPPFTILAPICNAGVQKTITGFVAWGPGTSIRLRQRCRMRDGCLDLSIFDVSDSLFRTPQRISKHLKAFRTSWALLRNA